MKFIITVDTEADDQWKNRGVIGLKNIEFLPRFQALCEKYNFIPTYLITYEVAEDDASVNVLKSWLDMGKCEIGAHLHPWTTPPYTQSEQIDKTENSFPNELSDEELSHKLVTLTDKIKENFCIKPTSFRAGRWGLDDRVIDNLIELGYIVDCSVTPRVSWSNFVGKKNGKGGPDFRDKDCRPGFVGHPKLLEVPMSIIYTGIMGGNRILSTYFAVMTDSFFKKILNKLFFQLKWCRIFSETKHSDLQKVYKAVKRNNLSVLEFMIHSSELMPGGSPYAKTEEAVEKIYSNLEQFFKYLKDQEVQSVTLSQFAKNFK